MDCDHLLGVQDKEGKFQDDNKNKENPPKKMKKKQKTIKVVELFAGVGGFRLGLEQASNRNFEFKTIWSNQWEPEKKNQIASKIYVNKFGEKGHSNEDIATVPVSSIPDHDLLVGGFPCQDYSVARSLNQAAGIVGKKGVLWWEIHRILHDKEKKPNFLFLENVDRLLKSPAEQRGRDFAVMLASLSDLGYILEWRVINAAEYGMPQRRRRVFFFGYRSGSSIHKKIMKLKNPISWILNDGLFAKAFSVNIKTVFPNEFILEGDLAEISRNFNKKKPSQSPFLNSGIMIDRKVWSFQAIPDFHGKASLLGDIILDEKEIPSTFFIDDAALGKWRYLKGSKKEKRLHSGGHEYHYTEGALPFPDPLNRPSRTIITAEGGSSPSRFKHVIQTPRGHFRRLTPIEMERLNMFPDDHTKGASDNVRAFLMGNALVVGVIKRVADVLISFNKF